MPMQEIKEPGRLGVQSLGQEDPLEEEMATCSCFVQRNVENPIDRGAWWAAVHGVTESDMTEHICTHALL